MRLYLNVILSCLVSTLVIGCASKGTLSENDPKYELVERCRNSLFAFVIVDSTLAFRLEQSLRDKELSWDQTKLRNKKADEHPTAKYFEAVGKLVGTRNVAEQVYDVRTNKNYAAFKKALAKYGDFILALEEVLPLYQKDTTADCKNAGYGFEIINLQDARAFKEEENREQERVTKVLESESVDLIQKFLVEHPQSKFRAQAELRVEFLSWEAASRSSDPKAIESFIAKFPKSKFVTYARTRQTYLQLLKSNNYDQILGYLRANEDSQYRAQLAERALDMAGLKDSFETYVQLALDVKEVRDQASNAAYLLIEKKISDLTRKGACAEAKELLSPLNTIEGFSNNIDVEKCKRTYKFSEAMASKNPRMKYFSAVQFEDSEWQDEAKNVYRDIIKRFPQDSFAAKASDRLLAIKDQESRKKAEEQRRAEEKDRKEQETWEKEVERTRERLREATRRAEQLKREQESCSINRSVCMSRCYDSNAAVRKICQSNCPTCY